MEEQHPNDPLDRPAVCASLTNTIVTFSASGTPTNVVLDCVEMPGGVQVRPGQSTGVVTTSGSLSGDSVPVQLSRACTWN